MTAYYGALYGKDFSASFIRALRDNYVPVAVDSYQPGNSADMAFYHMLKLPSNNFAFVSAFTIGTLSV